MMSETGSPQSTAAVDSAGESASARELGWSRLKGYVEIARIDHWFKNVFMLFGVALAIFHAPGVLSVAKGFSLLLALFVTCLVASSNYVLNEILDAPFDRTHPTKRLRAIPAGRVSIPIAYLEWIGLAVVAFALAAVINLPFLAAAVGLWVMGLGYNVRPLRFKDRPYLDVLSESINNPIRLLLGWFAVVPHTIPSISLLVAYWFIGAFFMATKRLAEYEHINDPELLARYRRSFGHYTRNRLLISMFYYVTLFALFCGIFIIRYHLELILATPLIAGFIGYYVQVGLKQDSAAQNPERLYRENGLVIFSVICVMAVLFLLFTNIPALYDLFNVEPHGLRPLWRF